MLPSLPTAYVAYYACNGQANVTTTILVHGSSSEVVHFDVCISP